MQLKIGIFRSYGDLVILLNVLDKFSVPDNFQIYLPVYYKELVCALNIRYNVIYIEGINEILSVYNKRQSNIVNILISIIKLNKIIYKNNLIVPTYGLMDRLFVFSFNIIKLKYIYIDLETFLSKYLKRNDSIEKNIKNGNLTIFPKSSRSNKDIPDEFIKILKKDIPELVSQVFFKDRCTIEHSSFSSFLELIEIIKGSRKIISADSLPIHLSLFYKIPAICVILQKRSVEWMPNNNLIKYILYEKRGNPLRIKNEILYWIDNA